LNIVEENYTCDIFVDLILVLRVQDWNRRYIWYAISYVTFHIRNIVNMYYRFLTFFHVCYLPVLTYIAAMKSKLKHCCSQWLLSLCCDHCKNREEMKLLEETLFSLTYFLLAILPVVLCRWDSWLFTWWEEYRMMVMS